MKAMAAGLALLAVPASAQAAVSRQGALPAIRSRLRACWRLVPGSPAAEATTPEGRPRDPGWPGAGRPEPVSAAGRAVAAARILLRCMGHGYPLPRTDGEAWRMIARRFDPMAAGGR
ncbi:hypothetical protein [Ponticoccus litoralis]|uniref:Uncharacterized protein n=1 Tax=Ponticoccus litoralis TaxID=422297 RepID=A0AAW9SSV9_9RHOB